MQLSRSSILEVRLVPRGRAIHFGTSETSTDVRCTAAFGGKAELPRFMSTRPSPSYHIDNQVLPPSHLVERGLSGVLVYA
jgi:hypothetical protein